MAHRRRSPPKSPIPLWSGCSLFQVWGSRLISSFLIGTFALSLAAVSAYIYCFGLDGFQIALFLVMFCACGFSITLGYRRLFSHLSCQAHWSVRLFVLVFGAAAAQRWVGRKADSLKATRERLAELRRQTRLELSPYDLGKARIVYRLK
jgi:hypothetical protein